MPATKDNKDEVDFDLSTYKEAFIDCRTFGHAWRKRWGVKENGQSVAVAVLTCRNGCGTTRTDTISRRTGEVNAPITFWMSRIGRPLCVGCTLVGVCLIW